MRRTRLAPIGFALLATAGVAIAMAAPAAADTGGLVWPDPTEPYYWDANENAGSTGPAPLPKDDLYWKDGEDAGGTGNAPQPNVPEYTDQGENAGAY